MKNNKLINTRLIVGTGILTAIEVVLYIIGTTIAIGGININLALVPICVGAILFGPLCGGFLGLVNGISVLLTPMTQAYFMDVNTFGELCILGTFVICLTKCTVAGIASYFIYKLFNNHKVVGSIVASLSVPIFNTGLFVLGALIFYETDLPQMIAMILTFNFLIEILTSIVLSPAIARIVTYRRNKKEKNQ